ncbi:MAG: hypothetical protein ACJ788_05585, partial [Ktedonobacteraceae bacterium]
MKAASAISPLSSAISPKYTAVISPLPPPSPLIRPSPHALHHPLTLDHLPSLELLLDLSVY